MRQSSSTAHILSHLPSLLILLTLSTLVPMASAQQTTTTETTTTIREYEKVIREIETKRSAPLLAAIFIKNRAGAQYDQKTRVLEDMITGEVTDVGIKVVSPEDTITAMRRFLSSEEQRERIGFDQRAAVNDENRLMSQTVDRMLENSTSALRLAQNMNADYLVIASITSFGNESRRINRKDLGIDRTIVTHKLRVSYKVLDIIHGGSETAGNILSTQKIQQDNSGGTSQHNQAVLDDLLADASVQLAAQLGHKIAEGRVQNPGDIGDMVKFTITCSMQDMSVPEIVKAKDGSYRFVGNRYQINPFAVTVELDGIAIGSAPGNFEGYPGLHHLRLTREGFNPWERQVNLRQRTDGEIMALNVPMTLDDKGYARWQDMTQSLANLKRDEALTEAQVEKIKGMAQMFRQSGIRIDWRSDIKSSTNAEIKGPPSNYARLPTVWE